MLVVGAVYRLRKWSADVGGPKAGEREVARAGVMDAEGLGREGSIGAVRVVVKPYPTKYFHNGHPSE